MDVLRLPLRGVSAAARAVLLSLLLAAVGCGGEEEGPSEEAALLEQGRRYIEEDDYARAALERSLVNPDNGYSQLRLTSYTPTRWGALPLWNPPVVPARFGEEPREGESSPLRWSEGPWTREALIALGREAFLRYPTQLASYVEEGLESPEAAARFGLWESAGEGVGGVVWARLPDGSWGASLSCASCHAAVRDGALVLGVNNDRLRLGDMIGQASGLSSGPASGWGAGRVDVTPDGAENPVAIPDLRPLRFQTHLHRTGSVRNDPVALAVRLETLIITSHGEAVRPPRVVTWAMALFLWSLGEEAPAPEGEGAAVFAEACAGCHRPPGYSGPPVRLDVVGTDPAVGLSATRGTGGYRAPSLRGVGERRLLTASGAVADLEELLDPRREARGHRFGWALSEAERAALLAFCRAL